MDMDYFKNFVYQACINAALGGLFFGYAMGIFNPLQDFIKQNVYPNITGNTLYLMTSFVPIGGALGAFIAAQIAQAIGRRKALLIADAIAIIASILCTVEDVTALLIGRLVTGFTVGLNSSLVPMYINEISPTEMKGITGTFTQIFIGVGLLLSYCVGLGVPRGHVQNPGSFWKSMIGFPVIICSVRVMLMATKFTLDTPKFLVQQGDDDGAQVILGKIYDVDRAPKELAQLKQQKKIENSQKKLAIKDLFNEKFKKRTFVGVSIALLQQLCGINAIIFYSTKIFTQNVTDPNDNTPVVLTIVVGVVNQISALLATAFVNKAGRKTLFKIGVGILLGSLVGVIMIDPTSSLLKYLIFIYLLGFGFSLGSISWIYVSEILPDIGIGIAFMSNWLACFVVAWAFPNIVDSMGMSVGFGIFAVICAFGYIFIEKYVPETKGLTSKENAELFTGGLDLSEKQMKNIRKSRFEDESGDSEFDRAI